MDAILEILKNVILITGTIVAVGTLIFHVKTAKLVARQKLWDSFFNNFNQINDYIAKYKNKLKTIPYPNLTSSPQDVGLIFHHLNMTLRYWINRDLLNECEKNGFKRWIEKVFLEHIKRDEQLSLALEEIINCKDLYPESFLDWFKENDEYKKIIKRNESAKVNK